MDVIWSAITKNLPKSIAISVSFFLLFWAQGCPPKVESLLNEQKLVTGPELQLELDTILAKADLRMADLEKQQRFRNLVLQNALLIVEGGTVNPVGLITAVAAIYGLGTFGRDTKNYVKKKRETP